MNTQNDKKHKKFMISLCRSIIPQKNNGKKLIINKIISLTAGCVFIVCAVLLIWDYAVLPASAGKSQQDIQKIYYSTSSSSMPGTFSKEPNVSSSLSERDSQGRLIKFIKLQKINKAIAGWIKIPNTIIDLPVLQADKKNPEYYLTHDYNNKNYKYGSIFADSRCSIEKGNFRSTLLYGHSLKSGLMFTELNKYKSFDFYKAAPVFTFDTVKNPSKWKIISVFLTNTLPEQGRIFNYLQTDFKNDSDFLNFVYRIRIRSLYNTGVSFNKNDQILLLSTCSYEFTGFREVVAARKVRKGENSEVDIYKAHYNNKVIFPDCWYKKYGGKKPGWPSTYEKAVKEKVLSWGE